MPAFFASTIGKVVIVALSIALVLGAAYEIEKVWSDSITEASDKGDKAGYDRARKELAERDNKVLQAALARVKELEEKQRAAEAQAAQDIADARVKHEKEIADANAKSASLAAAVLSGKRRLRDAEGRCTSGTTAGGDGQKTPATDRAGSAGGPGCELSGRTAGDLSRLAARADRVRANLRLCQTTLTAYAKACEGD